MGTRVRLDDIDATRRNGTPFPFSTRRTVGVGAQKRVNVPQCRHVVSSALSTPNALHVLPRCGNGTETWTRLSTAATPEAGFADGDGTLARFDGPSGLAVGNDGTLFVADTNNHLVRLTFVRNTKHLRTGGCDVADEAQYVYRLS